MFAVLAAGTIWAAGLAGAAMAKHYYGSIAFSPGTGSIGYSYDHPSKQSAINAALNGCYKYADDCVTAINFWDGACGAIAVGQGNGWGASWGEDMHFASDAALDACRTHTTRCVVKRYQCTRSP
jgi:serine/threonine-protein kinase